MHATISWLNAWVIARCDAVKKGWGVADRGRTLVPSPPVDGGCATRQSPSLKYMKGVGRSPSPALYLPPNPRTGLSFLIPQISFGVVSTARPTPVRDDLPKRVSVMHLHTMTPQKHTPPTAFPHHPLLIGISNQKRHLADRLCAESRRVQTTQPEVAPIPTSARRVPSGDLLLSVSSTRPMT